MNSRSCQTDIPDFGSGRTARRDKKNEVDMISKLKPRLRASCLRDVRRLHEAETDQNARQDLAERLEGDAVGRGHPGRGFDDDGEHDILLMQHLCIV